MALGVEIQNILKNYSIDTDQPIVPLVRDTLTYRTLNELLSGDVHISIFDIEDANLPEFLQQIIPTGLNYSIALGSKDIKRVKQLLDTNLLSQGLYEKQDNHVYRSTEITLPHIALVDNTIVLISNSSDKTIPKNFVAVQSTKDARLEFNYDYSALPLRLKTTIPFLLPQIKKLSRYKSYQLFVKFTEDQGVEIQTTLELSDKTENSLKVLLKTIKNSQKAS